MVYATEVNMETINAINGNENVNGNGKENNMNTREIVTPEMETEIKAEIAKSVYDLATHFNHTASTYGCSVFTNTAWDNKGNLRAIMRNHPNWNEREQAIIFPNDYTREIDKQVCCNFFDTMENIIQREKAYTVRDENGNLIFQKELNKLFRFRNVVMQNLTQFQTAESVLDYNGDPVLDENGYPMKANEVIDFANEEFGLKVHYNKRTSQVVNEVMTKVFKANEIVATRLKPMRDDNNDIIRDENGNLKFQEEKYKPYHAEFAKFADACNPIKVRKWTVLSINPLDFLTMSFGNSWSSCHTIDKDNIRHSYGDHYQGMHCGGCLNYALDEVTVIFYTVDEEYNRETDSVNYNRKDHYGFWTQDKINRQLIHCKGNVMITARIYPQACDGGKDLYKEFREIEEKVVADCLGKPNLWKYDSDSNHNGHHCWTASNTHHYHDYLMAYSGGTCIIKGDDGEYHENEYKMTIGAPGIDLDTGEEIGGSDVFDNVLSMSDANCYTCASCGDTIDEDDAIYINGEYYCRDCVYWCEYCQEYEVDDGNQTYVDGYGYLCEYGLDREIDNGNVSCCEKCGEYRLTESGYLTEDGEFYCDLYCAEHDGYVYDSYDGILIPEDEAIEFDGNWYKADDCEPCEECGVLLSPDTVYYHNGKSLCISCYREAIQQAAAM